MKKTIVVMMSIIIVVLLSNASSEGIISKAYESSYTAKKLTGRNLHVSFLSYISYCLVINN